MQLGALIKKDIGHQCRFIVAAVIFLILPYLIALITAITIQMGAHPQDDWTPFFLAASTADIILCVVLIPFFSGNAIAGERADRSSEFLAYLPIKRKTAILSKVLVAIGISTLFFTLCTLVYYTLFYLADARPRVTEIIEFGIVLGSFVFMFGTAWLVSTFAQSATYAAAAGIFIPISMGIILMLFNNIETPEQYHMGTVYVILSFVLGPLCFIAGVIYYLRRVEP